MKRSNVGFSLLALVLCLSLFGNFALSSLYSDLKSEHHDTQILLENLNYNTIFHLILAQETIYFTISDEIEDGNAVALPDFLRGAAMPYWREASVTLAKQYDLCGDDNLSDLLDRFWEIDSELEYQIASLSEEQLTDLGAICGELSELLIHSSTKKHDSLIEFVQAQDYTAVEYGTVVSEINHRLDHIADHILHID